MGSGADFRTVHRATQAFELPGAEVRESVPGLRRAELAVDPSSGVRRVLCSWDSYVAYCRASAEFARVFGDHLRLESAEPVGLAAEARPALRAFYEDHFWQIATGVLTITAVGGVLRDCAGEFLARPVAEGAFRASRATEFDVLAGEAAEVDLDVWNLSSMRGSSLTVTAEPVSLPQDGERLARAPEWDVGTMPRVPLPRGASHRLRLRVPTRDVTLTRPEELRLAPALGLEAGVVQPARRTAADVTVRVWPPLGRELALVHGGPASPRHATLRLVLHFGRPAKAGVHVKLETRSDQVVLRGVRGQDAYAPMRNDRILEWDVRPQAAFTQREFEVLAEAGAAAPPDTLVHWSEVSKSIVVTLLDEARSERGNR